VNNCSCYFWKEKVNTCCSEESSGTLNYDGTIDVFDSSTGLQGSISKSLVSQAIIARGTNGCDTSPIDACLAANDITISGGVANKDYPPSSVLGDYRLTSRTNDNINANSVSLQTAYAVFFSMFAGYSPEMKPPVLSSGTYYYNFWGIGVYDGGVPNNHGYWATTTNITQEHPEGGTHPMSASSFYDAISPCLQTASESELYSLMVDCTTGDLFPFIASELS